MNKWTLESLKNEALKYTTMKDFKKYSNLAYQKVVRDNLYKEVCSHLQYINKSYSDNEIKQIALGYKTPKHFKNNEPSLYAIALNRGILETICAHMKRQRSSFYNKQTASDLAKLCKSRLEFLTKYSGAYQYSCKKGFLDDICSHMKKPSNVSSMELELLEKIKTHYPEASKKRFCNIKINNKPHIKGFELDIYIPKLEKAIEFDGNYYHSFDFMRKNKARRDWPDEDLRNYHEIKDTYFKNSHNIEIFHVKESDWLLNKNECIKNCMNFLFWGKKE